MITGKYVEFFKGLEKNNNMEWFHEHKKQYEQNVKAPFLDLLDELLSVLTGWDTSLSMSAKDALFRINKDLRFSKDKTPYHTLLKAGISSGGKKSKLPGYYLGISADKIHVGGGLFNLDTNTLKAVRMLIADKPEEFMAIINDQDFKSTFGGLKGDRSKRLDKALQQVQSEVPQVANKQFYAMCEVPVKNYLDSNGLPDMILQHFGLIRPLNEYLNRAFV